MSVMIAPLYVGYTALDFLIVALAVLMMPAMSIVAGRTLAREAPEARKLIPRYLRIISRGWLTAAVVAAAWWVQGRPFGALGLAPHLRLWDYAGFAFALVIGLLMTAQSFGLAGAPRETVESMWKLGNAIGLAFQMVDDILDIVGPEEKIGKPVGSDLRAGIPSLPVVLGMMRNPEMRRLFEDPSHGNGANFDLALKLLRARLYDMEREAKDAARSDHAGGHRNQGVAQFARKIAIDESEPPDLGMARVARYPQRELCQRRRYPGGGKDAGMAGDSHADGAQRGPGLRRVAPAGSEVEVAR